jgi:hypothetical protein
MVNVIYRNYPSHTVFNGEKGVIFIRNMYIAIKRLVLGSRNLRKVVSKNMEHNTSLACLYWRLSFSKMPFVCTLN